MRLAEGMTTTVVVVVLLIECELMRFCILTCNHLFCLFITLFFTSTPHKTTTKLATQHNIMKTITDIPYV